MITEWSDFSDDVGGRENSQPSVLTIGSFDGVHRGHQYLIRQIVERARTLGITSVVVTFDPLPAEVLVPEKAPKRLTDIDERLGLLQDLGIDRCVVLRFSSKVAQMEAGDFLERAVSTYGVREIWVGNDFAFGHNRQGNVSFLARSTTDLDYGLHVVTRQSLGSDIISSTRIRALVAEGEVKRAAELLGHPALVSGPVVAGAGRGKDLGYPTANLSVGANHLVPATGIYAGFALLGGRKIPAAISVGYNPTFGDNPLSVEAFLLDFDRELRGERITLEFVGRLRSEQRFDSVNALIEQMNRDVVEARQILLDGGGVTGSKEARVEATGKNV